MRPVLAWSAAEAVALVPQLVLDRRMKRAGGPGIVPFELAGTPDRARRIMAEWGQDGRAAARAALVLDYPFLVAYTGFNVAVCDTMPEPFAGARRLARGAFVAAGACDAVENAALLGVLAGRDEALPGVARAFASAKFALLTAGLAYGAVAALAARR